MRFVLTSVALCGVLVASAFVPASDAAAGPEVPSALLAVESKELDSGIEAEMFEAVGAAIQSGESVEVEAAKTPTDRIVALPDGTLQLESSTVPVRTEVSSGEWVPINTDLVLRDGWWEPKASATPVRFSAGGSDVLDQIQTPNGEWLTETWSHGELPTPTIEGRTATYPEVYPGIDLQLTATELGMASVYVVKTPRAAENSKLAELGVTLDGAEISRERSGVFVAETESGDAITASSPLWWDSSDGGNADGPGESEPAMPVEHAFERDGIKLDVIETIKDQDPTYPIYVDPDWNSGPNATWYTDVAFPNQSYLSAGVSDILRMGRYAQYRGNAFFQFNIAALAGKQIISAQLSTTQTAVAASPNSPVQLRSFGIQASGFTWNQQNNALWGPVLGTQSPGSWGGPAVTVGWSVTSGVQARVGQQWVQFGLAPQDENAQSRRHFSRAATLFVNFNTPPNAPTAPQINSPERVCGTSSAPAAVSGSSVVVSVHQTDPDGGNVDTNFHLYRSTALTTAIQSKAPGLLAQGRRSVTWTGLTEGTYAWLARGSDHKIDGNGTSALCYFKVDNTAPPAPGVSTAATAFTVGQALNVSLTSSSDTAGYQYWFTPTAPTVPVPPSPVSVSRTTLLPDCTKREGGTRFVCANGATAVNISVAPVDAVSTLYVSAYDQSGNVSPAMALALFTSGGTPAARDPRVDTGHAWLTTAMIDPLPSVIDDSNWNLGADALPLYLPDDNISWQSVEELRPGYVVPVLRPHEPADPSLAMSTQGPAVNTTDSFTLNMWVLGASAAHSTQFIAQHWAPGSSFDLSLQDGKFKFCRTGSPGTGESAALVSNCVVSPNQIVDGEWVMVTGIWDRANQQLRLILGDSASPVAVRANAPGSAESWSGDGEFLIGPPPTSLRFTGLIGNPVVVPGVLDSRQLGSLSSFDSPFTF